ALYLEGAAPDPAAALALADAGEIPLMTNHDAGGVGPMSGVVTASMPVLIARDDATGLEAWCPLNEGSGRVLRYGADGPDVMERLVWMREQLGPALAEALVKTGPLDLIDIQAQALLVGDECHHRTEGGTAIMAATLAGLIPDDVDAFIRANGQFFLNVAMVSAKLALLCADGVPGSSLVTLIARNGVEVGIKLSGLGDAWFVGPAALPDPANLYDGYGLEDMNRDLGDSAIVEAFGLGGPSVAVSPLAAASVGLDPAEAPAITDRLRAIAYGSHAGLRLGNGGDRAPLGVDARKVVATGLRPPVHTGIAHRQPGVGQIGGGVTLPPMEAFEAAVEALDAA
ncbi:MAG: hypothetical protein QOF76_5169, partial [Solirubrobacteraceae bacterium]|nr:hypothetical protein [Solirubrobacteraceae bacterium]